MFQAYGDVQLAQIIYKNKQSFPKESCKEIRMLASSSDLLPSISCNINNGSSIFKEPDPSLSLINAASSPSYADSPITICSEESSTESEEINKDFVPVKQFVTQHIEQISKVSETDVFELHNEIEDLAEAGPSASFQVSQNIEECKDRNPLLILLRKTGLRYTELIDNPHRNDVVLEGHDINFIARVVIKHLISLTAPPKRKILTSTLTKWAEYFKYLFPKTPVSSFYNFKYEACKQKYGIIPKKKAQGALQVQLRLFQERRKLIKEDPSVLLRRRNINSIVSDKSADSGDTFIVKKTWRPVSQQEGEEVQSCDGKVLIGNYSRTF